MFDLGFMPRKLNGIDISNYQYDDILALGRTIDEQCERWAASGVEAAMLGTWYPDKATPFIKPFAANGIQLLSTYSFLEFGMEASVTRMTQQAIAIAQQAGAGAVTLDIEASGAYEAAGATPDIRIADTERAVEMVQAAKLEPIIYSGPYYWQNQMANTTRFAALKLHHAQYFYDMRILSAVAYGGWTSIYAHQVTATGNQCYVDADGTLGTVPALDDVPVDYNYFWETDMGMTPEQIAEMEAIKAEADALNAAVVKRADITRLATGTDAAGYANMLKAWDVLNAAGLIAAPVTLTPARILQITREYEQANG